MVCALRRAEKSQVGDPDLTRPDLRTVTTQPGLGDAKNGGSGIIRKHEYKTTLVRKGASIGANATIVCGNEIGEYAFIGAGAVVTKPVPAFALMVGNPARQKGWISEYGHRLEFNAANIAVCEESKQEYLLENNIVKRLK